MDKAANEHTSHGHQEHRQPDVNMSATRAFRTTMKDTEGVAGLHLDASNSSLDVDSLPHDAAAAEKSTVKDAK